LQRALEIFSYQWVSDSCKLFNFRPGPLGNANAGALLKKMNRAKIVFVGDSLINEQYGSLKVQFPAPALLLHVAALIKEPPTGSLKKYITYASVNADLGSECPCGALL